jgi:transcriptional regulator GlxA family with amidase domain
MSVCTGALILASAGLLDDRPTTTHWAYVDILEGLGAEYLHQRWVEDGKYLTTAGVSADIDGGLYLTSRLVGEEAAPELLGAAKRVRRSRRRGRAHRRTAGCDRVPVAVVRTGRRTR